MTQAVPQSVKLVSAPSVGDPGFEHPSVATNPNLWVLGMAADAAWQFTGTAGVSANNSGYTASLPPAPEGAQVAVLQEMGSFTQTVNGWAAGSYQISFQAAQRVDNKQDFQLLIDNTVVGTFTPTGNTYQLYTTPTFSVAAGSHTVTFQGLDNANGTIVDNTALIDAISLTLAAAPVVGDSGFEQPGVFTYTDPHTRIDALDLHEHRRGQIRSRRQRPGGYTGNLSAPEGLQVAFLQKQGSFSQTVQGWTAGSYQINFQAAQRAGQHQDFQVLIDTTVVGTFTPGTGYQTYTTAPLTLAAGSHTHHLQGSGHCRRRQLCVHRRHLGVAGPGPG